jgi:hypothetical protein
LRDPACGVAAHARGKISGQRGTYKESRTAADQAGLFYCWQLRTRIVELESTRAPSWQRQPWCETNKHRKQRGGGPGIEPSVGGFEAGIMRMGGLKAGVSRETRGHAGLKKCDGIEQTEAGAQSRHCETGGLLPAK